LLIEAHQLMGLFVRERAQEDGVDDAEDGGVGTDSERQGNHGNGREAGSPDPRPERVANVLEGLLHARAP
jgi:hypothetical protein